jgi:hypothetical protein
MLIEFSAEKRQAKLGRLIESEGYDTIEQFLADNAHDSVVPGICLTKACNYTTDVPNWLGSSGVKRTVIHSEGSYYSITSSARAKIDCGTVRPSVLAVFRLMISSKVDGCCTGRSAGLVPLRIFST